MSESSHPELDDSPILDPRRHSQFRSLLQCANWLVTLGRFDIAYAFNTSNRYSMQPRDGHLVGMIRVFGYLQNYPKGKIVIDPDYPDHSLYPTPVCDNWKEFYPDTEEMLPPKSQIPNPKGPQVRMTVFKDADHAHNVVTRKSVIGILLLLNNILVKWITKRQKMIESSTYGSELCAGKMAIELILEYR